MNEILEKINKASKGTKSFLSIKSLNFYKEGHSKVLADELFNEKEETTANLTKEEKLVIINNLSPEVFSNVLNSAVESESAIDRYLELIQKDDDFLKTISKLDYNFTNKTDHVINLIISDKELLEKTLSLVPEFFNSLRYNHFLNKNQKLFDLNFDSKFKILKQNIDYVNLLEFTEEELAEVIKFDYHVISNIIKPSKELKDLALSYFYETGESSSLISFNQIPDFKKFRNPLKKDTVVKDFLNEMNKEDLLKRTPSIINNELDDFYYVINYTRVKKADYEKHFKIASERINNTSSSKTNFLLYNNKVRYTLIMNRMIFLLSKDHKIDLKDFFIYRDSVFMKDVLGFINFLYKENFFKVYYNRVSSGMYFSQEKYIKIKVLSKLLHNVLEELFSSEHRSKFFSLPDKRFINFLIENPIALNYYLNTKNYKHVTFNKMFTNEEKQRIYNEVMSKINFKQSDLNSFFTNCRNNDIISVLVKTENLSDISVLPIPLPIIKKLENEISSINNDFLKSLVFNDLFDSTLKNLNSIYLEEDDFVKDQIINLIKYDSSCDYSNYNEVLEDVKNIILKMITFVVNEDLLNATILFELKTEIEKYYFPSLKLDYETIEVFSDDFGSYLGNLKIIFSKEYFDKFKENNSIDFNSPVLKNLLLENIYILAGCWSGKYEDFKRIMEYKFKNKTIVEFTENKIIETLKKEIFE